MERQNNQPGIGGQKILFRNALKQEFQTSPDQ
jgi:hypothetical protein